MGIRDDGERFGRRAWLEQRLFEVLGTWSTTTTDAALRVALATACRRHEWHARLWRDLVPVVPGPTPDELEAGTPAWVALLDAVAAPDDDALRAVGAWRVLLAHLVTGDDAALAAVAPPAATHEPLRRVLTLVLADDVDEWRRGEAHVRRLLADEAALAVAARHQGEVEALLLAAAPRG